ncbi:ABC transporter substrate-binding protein [Pseudaminobacter manganicus]|uniref:ABC transporter substrate-binding protein n=2 Tax=Manganibacter manganicus TaxID=1873176 RepID=A0A1V8RUX8_9HYPH|nr:ABC transporter substrate-binding protein [Pseudaminobacter manganicus]OQM76948.1 ABC transporter substrate-binding protein [Pseudaminobacter manganicus]
MTAVLSGYRYTGAAFVAALMAFAFAPSSAQATSPAPRRVVSINLCTDQMAMLMAAPGQLKSVSSLATEKGTSVMIDEAARYPLNHGQAEEVFLMHPDLVLAGTYTAKATVALLKELGFHVETFKPASSFNDVRENLTRLGVLLRREGRAAELVAELDNGLAELAVRKVPRKNAVFYYANSYTSGSGTLADAIVKAAGLANLGDALGFKGMTRLPLELLIFADPDLIIEGDSQYGAPALAKENFAHPAFRAMAERVVPIPDKYTICGGPFTLEASRILQRAALKQGAVDR